MDEKRKLYVGMDVHKDTVMVAVLPEGAPEPTMVKRLPNEAARRGGGWRVYRGRGRFGPATRRAARATCWSGRCGVGDTDARSWRRR